MITNKPSMPVTREELMDGMAKAQAARQSYIQSAIDSGVPITYPPPPRSTPEQETIIITSPASTTIDTTVPSDINRCIKNKYTITALTYYNDRLVGATFETTRNKITLRA